MDFNALQIPAPKRWEDFEDLCHSLFKSVWQDPLAQKNGRRGQAQHGVDIFGSTKVPRSTFQGVQCKGKDQNYGGKVTETELTGEIAKAELFRPPLEHWILATTAPADAGIQTLARQISKDRAAVGKFTVQVLAWEELQELIAERPKIIGRYYPQLAHDLSALTEALQSVLAQQSTNTAGIAFSQTLVDQEISSRLATLRQARFFPGFDPQDYARRFAISLDGGELCSGSPNARARALGWCARLLALREPPTIARDILALSESLGKTDEAVVANAFIVSANNSVATALSKLASLPAPFARTPSLFIVANKSGASAALSWIDTAQLTMIDFDSEGRFLFIRYCLVEGHWDRAFDCVNQIEECDTVESPALLFVSAIAHLCMSVPAELREVILDSPPFELASFSLLSDPESLQCRRTARERFGQFAAAARALDLTSAEQLAEDFVLWLMLRDPRQKAAGLKRIEESLRDSQHSLRRLHFALHFGITFNRQAVEREIERRIALAGEVPSDAAQARFVLALAQADGHAVANYIKQHSDELYKNLRTEIVASVEIEALVRAGLVQRANERLAKISFEQLGGNDRIRVQRLIDEAGDADPITSRKSQFEKSDALIDLAALISAMEEKADWAGLCKYGAIFFARTMDVSDGARLVRALNEEHRFSEIVELCEHHAAILEQSRTVQITRCWALFYEGDLNQSHRRLTVLQQEADDPNIRALRVNLAMSSGNWDALIEFVSDEWSHRSERDAEELLHAGQLALMVESPRAKQLVKAAVKRAGEDPTILAGAYFLATSAGWDDDPTVSSWLGRAAALSDDTGPLQRMSLQEIVDRKPEWDRHETETWKTYNAGDIPIFAAARQLRRSVVDLTVLPALANPSEPDPRRRGQILAFSGARNPFPDLQLRSIAIDPVALYTLSVLGDLSTVIETFDRVVIAHSTLSWLLREMEKARFHQPSRIERAHRIRDLLARKQLTVLRATAYSDHALEAEVGEGLATLISAAREVSESSDKQGVVVRSAPVHRLGSLMAEEADLSEHQLYLYSCGAVVTILMEKGLLTAEEEQRARDYLTLHERDWPDQPTIADDAHLFLDGLSVEYLDHLGLLDKLKAANLSAFILGDEEEEATALIEYAKRASGVIDVIEDVRRQLAAGVTSGKIQVARADEPSDDSPHDLSSNPTFAVLSAAASVDALVVDDRFINQHAYFSANDYSTPILTTVDMLDQLRTRRSISEDQWFTRRSSLRRAGYAFLPLTSKELERYLYASKVVDTELVETKELRSIRESLLRAQMATTLQLPRDAPWLASVTRTLIGAVKFVWLSDEDIVNSRARAAWLVNQADIRGWAHALSKNGPKALISETYGAQLLQLFTAPLTGRDDKAAAYLEWIEDFIVQDVAETTPALFDWIVERARELVSESANIRLSTDDAGEELAPRHRAAIALEMTKLFPASIRTALVEQSAFRNEFGLTADSEFSYGSAERTFRRSALFAAMRAVLDGVPGDRDRVDDIHGKTWQLEADLDESVPSMALRQDEQRIGIPSFAVLAGDKSVRLRALEDQAQSVNLPSSMIAMWGKKAADNGLDDDDVVAFYDDLNDTPIRVEQGIRGELAKGKCSLSTLVPRSTDYYERLIGVYGGEESVSEYAVGGGRAHLQGLSEWRSEDGYRWGLLLSSHSSLCTEVPVDSTDIESTLRWLIKNGDLYSLLGGIETALRVPAASKKIVRTLKLLVQRLNESFSDEESDRYRLLSALIMLVDGELARTRTLAETPPFYRRAASIAQASLIERAVNDADANDESFRDWAMNQRGQPFQLQTLVDTRLEPRWQPNFVVWRQLRNELVGRLLNASFTHGAAYAELDLGELIGDGPESLKVRFEPGLTSLPGPLEGAPHCENVMPKDLRAMVSRDIDAMRVTPKSFIPLINVSLLFGMDDGWANKAIRALQKVERRLAGVRDQQQLEAVLQGLATLAAITRHSELADELLTLIRRYVGRGRDELPIDSAFRVVVTASACSDELDAWCKRLGHDLTLLAYEDQSSSDSRFLISSIDWLCHFEPELWGHCSRALAALRSIVDR